LGGSTPLCPRSGRGEMVRAQRPGPCTGPMGAESASLLLYDATATAQRAGVLASRRQCVDALDYAFEFLPTAVCAAVLNRALDAEAAAALVDAVNTHDVVVFVRPRGRASADAARLLFQRVAEENTVKVVSADGEGGDWRTHLALRAALGPGRPLEYPAVVVRGIYVGGLVEVEKLLQRDAGLAQRLGADRAQYDGPPAALPRDAGANGGPFDMCKDARGDPSLRFQTCTYASVLRGHALVFLLLNLAAAAAPPKIARGCVAALAADLLLFLLLGPTVSVAGVAVSKVLWRVRGGVVSVLPYKVVCGLYVGGYASILATGAAGGKEARAVLGSMIANSALIVVLRF